MIVFCKGRVAFRELSHYADQRAVLPLKNVTYYAPLMTNKPYLRKKPKTKNILKGDVDVQSGHSAEVNRDEKSLQQLRIWPVDYNQIDTA